MNNDSYNFSWHLHVNGLVQGIGFRPYVYRVATQLELKGWVKNDNDGLHVVFNASLEQAEFFKKQITVDAPPPLARIVATKLSEIPNQEFLKFEIIHDTTNSSPNLLLTPDLSLCVDCRKDLLNAGNRRNLYAFTSCSQCGPRYSVIENLPYDRGYTKMNDFTMCASCLEEYSNPANRRYYAQTISCPECRIQLSLLDNSLKIISSVSSQIINQVIQSWKAGKIIAIKGIGGYLITCDANNTSVIQKLRRLKHRPTKPLAVMYPNMESLNQFELSKEAMEALVDPISPIVLIPIKKEIKLQKGICNQHDHVGIMLPYAPVFKVLLEAYQLPIIATSGNVSNSPITYQDENIKEDLLEISDYILTNNRGIVIPQDDSVLKFTAQHKQKIILRRSRGMAPTYMNADLKWNDESILSTGAQLKSTFSILHKQKVYISQYLGDLDSYNVKVNYEKTMKHLLQLLKVKPSLVLSDYHKAYESTKHGLSYASDWKIPIQYVQHHLAHFSAILGEHNLLETKEKILGIIWDGAGLGTDDSIWGSEFFLFENYKFKRHTHLPYFDNLLGDKMAKEPRLSALSICSSIKEGLTLLKTKFSPREWENYLQIIKNGKLLKTSSMGRLFDAVAFLLGIADEQTFEGEAAMLLEVAARNYMNKQGLNLSENGYYFDSRTNPLSVSKLVALIIDDIKTGLSVDTIAFKFHMTLVNWIKAIALDLQCNKLAFSGGVFQNSLLVDLLISHLGEDYTLYFHQELSPNDESISFGQLIFYQIQQKGLKNA